MQKLFYFVLIVGFSFMLFSSASAATNDSNAAQLVQLAQLQNTLTQLQQQAAAKETLSRLQAVLNDIQAKINNHQIPSSNILAVSETLLEISNELNQMNLALNSSAPTVSARSFAVSQTQSTRLSAAEEPANINTPQNQDVSQLAAIEPAMPATHFNKRKILRITFGITGAVVLVILGLLFWKNNKDKFLAENNKTKPNNNIASKFSQPSQLPKIGQTVAEWKVKQEKSA